MDGTKVNGGAGIGASSGGPVPFDDAAPREPQRAPAPPPFFSIAELAERWRCSRASVYNRIRGQKVVDFAAHGRKGHKLVPLEVVLRIERSHMRILR